MSRRLDKFTNKQFCMIMNKKTYSLTEVATFIGGWNEMGGIYG